MGEKHFCFFQTAETGNRTPISGVKGSGANHYPRAPAHADFKWDDTARQTQDSKFEPWPDVEHATSTSERGRNILFL